jgi:CHAT domain-containing protein
MSFRLLATLVLFLPTSFAWAQTEKEREATGRVLHAYLDAFAARDLDKVMDQIARKAPDRELIQKASRDFFQAAGDIRFADRELSSWKVVEGRPRVTLRATRHWRNLGSGDRLQAALSMDVYFIKEGDAWKIWKFTTSMREFIKKVFDARTKEERAQLLAAEKELVNDELVDVLAEVGENLVRKSQPEEADLTQTVLGEVAGRLGTDRAHGQAHLVRGLLATHRGNYRTAAQEFETARDRFHKAKEAYREGWMGQELAGARLTLGRYPEALQAITTATEVHDRWAESQSQEIRDSVQAANLEILGRVQLALGDLGAARSAAERSAGLAKTVKAPLIEARARRLLGLALSGQGFLAEALLEAQESLNRLPKDMEYESAECCYVLGLVLLRLHQFPGARESLQKSQRLYEKLGNPLLAARPRVQLSMILLAEGHYPAALEESKGCMEVLARGGSKSSAFQAQLQVGLAAMLLDRPAEAQKVLEASLALARELKVEEAEAMALCFLGWVFLDQEKYKEAALHEDAARKLALRTGSRECLKACGLLRGGISWFSKEWESAVKPLEEVVGLIEQDLTGALEPNLRRGLLEYNTTAYRMLAACRARLGAKGEEQAFAVSERAKARTLIDLLAQGKADISRSLSDRERQDEQQLRTRLNRAEVLLRVARDGGTDAERTRAHDEVEAARSALEKFERALYLNHANLRDLRARFEPASLEELDRSLFAAEPGLVILSYLVWEDETLLFALAREQPAGPVRLKVHRIPLKSKDLAELARKFRFRCSGPDLPYQEEARELYQHLLGPVEKQLEGKTHLVLLPDGPLLALPFHALLDGKDRHLIEKLSVSYAPSATALKKLVELGRKRDREPPPPTLGVVFGRPTMPAPWLSDLKHTEAEAKEVAKKLGTEAILGPDATESRAYRELPQASYIHIATHGKAVGDAPLYSYVALAKDASEDGLLYARELMKLELHARLVVLSACETGSGRDVPGEGLLGLSWSLFVAGAPSQLLTQWSVSDRTTSPLMEEFYKQLSPGGAKHQAAVGKAEALRQAQLTLLKDKKTSHPDFWAPFVLMGDWGK